MDKIKQVLQKPFDKRTNQELYTIYPLIAKYFKTIEMNLLKLIIFYLRYYDEQINLTKQLNPNSMVFLLKGKLKLQEKIYRNQDNSYITTEKIINPRTQAILQKPQNRLLLLQNSIVITISQQQYNNCLTLRTSSLQQQIQFMLKNPYFENLSKKSAIYLIYFAEIKPYYKSQNIFNNPQSLQKIYLVRKGQFQISQSLVFDIQKNNNKLQDGSKIKDTIQILKFYQSEFFGNIEPNGINMMVNYITKCKSAQGILYQYDKSFFNTFNERFPFEKIKSFKEKIENFLNNQSNKIKNFRKNNLDFLTQAEFFRKKHPVKKSLPNLFYKQPEKIQTVKPISSRRTNAKDPPFEELTKLQSNKQKCMIYKKLKEPLRYTKNQIFYEFFKNNWQYTHNKHKKSK